MTEARYAQKQAKITLFTGLVKHIVLKKHAMQMRRMSHKLVQTVNKCGKVIMTIVQVFSHVGVTLTALLIKVRLNVIKNVWMIVVAGMFEQRVVKGVGHLAMEHVVKCGSCN